MPAAAGSAPSATPQARPHQGSAGGSFRVLLRRRSCGTPPACPPRGHAARPAEDAEQPTQGTNTNRWAARRLPESHRRQRRGALKLRTPPCGADPTPGVPAHNLGHWPRTPPAQPHLTRPPLGEACKVRGSKMSQRTRAGPSKMRAHRALGGASDPARSLRAGRRRRRKRGAAHQPAPRPPGSRDHAPTRPPTAPPTGSRFPQTTPPTRLDHAPNRLSLPADHAPNRLSLPADHTPNPAPATPPARSFPLSSPGH